MTRSATLLLAALASAAALSTPAAADDQPTASPAASAAFGNTVLTIDPDGRSRKIWLQPDGTWTGKSRRGLDLAGKWSVKGEKVCLSQSKPRLPGSMCEAFPARVGAEITTKAAGKTVTVKLVKGHVTQ